MTKVDAGQTARLIRASRLAGFIDDRALRFQAAMFARGYRHTEPKFDVAQFGFSAGLGRDVADAGRIMEATIAEIEATG